MPTQGASFDLGQMEVIQGLSGGVGSGYLDLADQLGSMSQGFTVMPPGVGGAIEEILVTVTDRIRGLGDQHTAIAAELSKLRGLVMMTQDGGLGGREFYPLPEGGPWQEGYPAPGAPAGVLGGLPGPLITFFMPPGKGWPPVPPPDRGGGGAQPGFPPGRGQPGPRGGGGQPDDGGIWVDPRTGQIHFPGWPPSGGKGGTGAPGGTEGAPQPDPPIEGGGAGPHVPQPGVPAPPPTVPGGGPHVGPVHPDPVSIPIFTGVALWAIFQKWTQRHGNHHGQDGGSGDSGGGDSGGDSGESGGSGGDSGGSGGSGGGGP